MDSVDEYISAYPQEVQDILRRIRAIVQENAPGAIEGISYKIPAYKIHGRPLVYFAAFPHHIGFYATSSGHEKFSSELSGYKQGKGSVQFPLDREIPYDLIARIVRFRVEENLARVK